MFFLDTNLIIRFVTQDNADQASRAGRVFHQLETSAITATTSESVIVEAVQVLSSKTLYRLPRAAIETILSKIITLPGLNLADRPTILLALALYVAHMERLQVTTILSFDRDFDRIPGITRQEP